MIRKLMKGFMVGWISILKLNNGKYGRWNIMRMIDRRRGKKWVRNIKLQWSRMIKKTINKKNKKNKNNKK